MTLPQQWWRPLAERGDANIQAILGAMYEGQVYLGLRSRELVTAPRQCLVFRTQVVR
jgi:hypothetical protein